MKYQFIKQPFILKKIFIFSILFFSFSSLRAEHFFDFYIQNLDFSEYPTIKVKGGVLEFEYGDTLPESITFLENDNEVSINVELKRLQKTFQLITITYKTTLPKETIRKFNLRYDDNGYHNGSDGQFFEYNPKKYKYIKEIDGYNGKIDEFEIETDKYASNFNYINNIILNYERNGLEKMYVLALNGLLVREQPEISSEVIGKLDFGTMAEASIEQYGEEIKVTENEKLNLEIEGQFRRINYNGNEGYVFDGYLTTLSFFKSGDNQNYCSIIYNSQVQEKSNQTYRIQLDHDKYGEYLSLKYISLEKTYLIAQAIFKQFNSLKIEEHQEYGEIYNGGKHYKFNHENFMFKLYKYNGYYNSFGCNKIYFECYQ